MNYKIDPCKSCQKYYDIKDVNNIKTCAFGNVARYYGNNINILDLKGTPEYIAARNCVNESVIANGKKPIDMRIAAPPIINRVNSNFFPYLNSGKSITESRNKCITDCSSQQFPNQCIQECNIDADSVIMQEGYTSNVGNTSVNTSVCSKKNKTGKSINNPWKVGIF